jgi:3-oxoacyl-[acyl-carrier protein] reductase
MSRTRSPRRALVTGATGGIGTAVAVALAAEGASLWLTYAHGREKAEAAATECERLGADSVVISRLDLRDPDAVAAFAASVQQEWTSLQVLINNGGICKYQSLDEIGLEDWDATMETNARGTFLLTRALYPALRATSERGDDAVVVNVASIAGQVGGLATSMAYAASKGAVLAMTRGFARLWANEGIRVNAVTPGPISTAITDQLTPSRRAELASGVPLGRFGTSEEVAWIITMLASGRAGFVTGATYDVNGGLRID